MVPKTLVGLLIAVLLSACETRVQGLQLDSTLIEDSCQSVATTGDAYRECLEVGPDRYGRRA